MHPAGLHPSCSGTEAPALGTPRPGRASLPLTAHLCALSRPLLMCWGNLGTRYLPLASDMRSDLMGLSPSPVGPDAVSRETELELKLSDPSRCPQTLGVGETHRPVLRDLGSDSSLESRIRPTSPTGRSGIRCVQGAEPGFADSQHNCSPLQEKQADLRRDQN
ncbi:unnamed protein product [Rangifer tarandus platyrhynchus]|uniref:Uncharacterized protein n=1 Tax=Rangifer tarandus platyrhynchus TaxID=3082113 RepID=A0AC59YFJ8_RANTA